MKALLIKHQVEFPYVHDLAELLTLLEKAGTRIPESVQQSERLTRFAVFTRYPGLAPAVSEQEYRKALRIAEGVVRWAEKELRK